MAEPDWNPDTGGRSLAEILREAGIESATRQSRRRKWDDPDEAGLRQRRAEAAAEGAAARSGHGRRQSDRSSGGETPPVAGQPRSSREGSPADRDGEPLLERRSRPRRPADPSTAAIPGLRPDRKPGVPAAGAMPSAPVPSMSPGRAPSGPLHSAPVPARAVPSGSSAGAGRAGAPVREQRAGARSAREDVHHNTGPIPVIRPEDIRDDLDAGSRGSALAWLRFAGELLIALAAGIGIYFAATLLWDNVPYLAVLLVPVAVTGLVAAVGAWRQRQGQEPISSRLLAVLVFAGTLLTVAPAAGLLLAS